MKNFLWIVVLGGGLVACSPSGEQSSGGRETSASSAEQAAESQEECSYSVDPAAVRVAWTAYKTTDKIAVEGVFDTVEITGAKPAASLAEALEGITVIVNTSSINSANPERDAKIIKFFFGMMSNWEKVIGDIVAVQGDENRGEITLDLSLNGITRQIVVPYVQERGVLVFQTEVDLTEWNADSSIASLNRACYDLHTGPDGVSKLWPTVRFEVRAPFEKRCP